MGRDAELGRLQTAVADLRSGRGQVVLLVGDAGLGKTRMLAELLSLAGDDVTRLEGRCVSYGAGSPYGPFVELLRTWLGVEESDAELAVRTKLRARAGALLGATQERVCRTSGYCSRSVSSRTSNASCSRSRPTSSPIACRRRS